MVRILATCTMLSLVVSPSPQNAPVPTAREVALRFALDNGLDIRTKDVIVGIENNFGAIDNLKVPTPSDTLTSVAQDLARTVGRDAKAGSAEDALTCLNSACVPKDKPVILVNDPDNNGVLIRAYLPTDKPEYDGYKWLAVVVVTQKDGRWVATQFRAGPSKVAVRLK